MNNDLFYFAFGIPIESDSEFKKKRCVHKAYLDLCRTLRYKEEQKNSEEKDHFINDVETQILEEIKSYPSELKDTCNMDYLQNDFDIWHWSLTQKLQNILEKYKDIFVDSKTLTVGQAQKWINMTIKYMILMGIEDIAKIPKKDIHIPLDDFILTAAEVNEDISILDSFTVKGLGIKKRSFKNISPWSGIDEYETYMNYQNAVREKCNNKAPIEWERKAWIAEATRRSIENKQEDE